MRNGNRVRRTLTAVGATLVVGGPALAADSLSDSVEQFLNRAQTKIDDTKIWKFQVKPSLRESVIWTDNVYLNDRNENDLKLTKVTDTSSGAVTTDPGQLARIAAGLPDFKDATSLGRKSDFIFQSEVGADLILPVNDSYYNAFKQHQLTILGIKARDQQYLNRDELDNNSLFLHTDLFGFVSDLMNQQWGDRVWVRARDDYSYLRDPLDAEIRVLGQTRITEVKRFNDFGRTENTANVDAGFNGAECDASLGYENYHLWLSDHALDQAQHVRHDVHAEVGTVVPGMETARVFARYDYAWYRFDKAPVTDALGNSVGDAQILNDADVNKGTLGFTAHNDKVELRAESAYENWRPLHHSGLSGDTNEFAGVVSHVQVAYKPWEERETKFQLEFVQSIDYSAISNFNSDQTVMFSVQHPVIPQRLDADFDVSFTTTNPSQGPYRKLLETGFGLTYHAYKQVDVTFRYLFRHQTAHNEIETVSDFQQNGNLYEYHLSSDSAFYQNIVELGVLVHF